MGDNKTILCTECWFFWEDTLYVFWFCGIKKHTNLMLEFIQWLWHISIEQWKLFGDSQNQNTTILYNSFSFKEKVYEAIFSTKFLFVVVKLNWISATGSHLEATVLTMTLICSSHYKDTTWLSKIILWNITSFTLATRWHLDAAILAES